MHKLGHLILLGAMALFLAACAPAIKEAAPADGPHLSFHTPQATSTAAPNAATSTAAPTASAPTPTRMPSPSPVPSPSPIPPPIEAEVVADGFYFIPLDEALKARITGMSYPADARESRIHYDDLRYVGLLHYDFEGAVHTGELIVHKQLAKEVAEIFYALYEHAYPLTSVRLVDDFEEPGDDNLSMAANNTSAFNYRRVTGSKTLSRHSYGAAIDINPRLNPYIDGDRVAPENGAQYADRSLDFAGKIDHDDLCYKLFTSYGWSWGGDWKGDKDYQHFSKDIDF